MSFSASGMLFQNEFETEQNTKTYLSGWNPSLKSWSGFGGKKRKDETSSETAIREVVEEVFQVQMKQSDILSLQSELDMFDFKQNGSYVVFFMRLSSLFQISVFLEKNGYRTPLYNTFPQTSVELLEKRNIPDDNPENYEITYLSFVTENTTVSMDPSFLSDFNLK